MRGSLHFLRRQLHEQLLLRLLLRLLRLFRLRPIVQRRMLYELHGDLRRELHGRLRHELHGMRRKLRQRVQPELQCKLLRYLFDPVLRHCYIKDLI